MAKFIKSIFTTSDKRSHHYEEGTEEERADTPPMGGRRQLSISRSGRMRQANKKRHSLSLDVYGDNDNLEPVEKPKSMEYHVHTAPIELGISPRRFSAGDNTTAEGGHVDAEVVESQKSLDTKLRKLVDGEKSPEEEIDNAFEILDKS